MKYTDEQILALTPIQFNAQCRVHAKLNSSESNDDKTYNSPTMGKIKKGTIDELDW